MNPEGVLQRLTLGACAGLAGTLALQGMRTLSERSLPSTMPRVRQDPGEFMVGKLEARLPAFVRARIPARVKAGAAKGIAAGYGITAGTIHALLRARPGDTLLDGVALGMGTWAAGYVGWLPAVGLSAALSEQRSAEILGPITRHALFGIAVVTAYGLMSRRTRKIRSRRSWSAHARFSFPPTAR